MSVLTTLRTWGVVACNHNTHDKALAVGGTLAWEENTLLAELVDCGLSTVRTRMVTGQGP